VDFELFGLYFGAFTACFCSFILGYIDLKVIHEMVTERDRSVPVRWLGGGEDKIWGAAGSVTAIGILYVMTLRPWPIHWEVFFLSWVVLGSFMVISYILLNLDYRLPPSAEGEVQTFLDKQRGHSHRAR
jgi:hypothetical protein